MTINSSTARRSVTNPSSHCFTHISTHNNTCTYCKVLSHPHSPNISDNVMVKPYLTGPSTSFPKESLPFSYCLLRKSNTVPDTFTVLHQVYISLHMITVLVQSYSFQKCPSPLLSVTPVFVQQDGLCNLVCVCVCGQMSEGPNLS